MAALQRTLRHEGQVPKHWDPDLLLHTCFEARVQHGGAAIQDHAPNPTVRPEFRQSLYQGGRREGPPSGVRHQYRRRPCGSCQIIGACVTAHSDAVIITHDSLDHGQTAPRRVLRKQSTCRVRPQEKQIQVPGFCPNDLTMEHGIDVVRSAFKGNWPHSAVYQRLENSAGHRGLTSSAGGGTEEEPRRLTHRAAPPR